jgi:nucleotide-binding universal stress UspA family protein
MKKRLILHPTDGSKQAKKALEYAAELAVSAGAKLLVLHVQPQHGADSVPDGLGEFERIEQVRVTEADVLRGAAETLAGKAAQTARAKGVKQVERLVVEGDPVQAIVATARARKADAIVMGSRGLGYIKGLFLGSVSHKVVLTAPCTCIVVR